jgi:hypothetical protein
MSMSESEHQQPADQENVFPSTIAGHAFPDDFSEDDKTFAQELDYWFDYQAEEMPPYFVQTLMEPDEARFQPVEYGFEHKTRARVFRRLKLRRRLYQHDRHASFRSRVSSAGRRKSLVLSIACALILSVTVAFTAPSFAAGLQILLRGAQSGVLNVTSYPAGKIATVKNSKHGGTQSLYDAFQRSEAHYPTKMGLAAAQQQLDDWPIYAPQALPDNYTLSNVYLYKEWAQQWVDGPFVELDYNLTGVKPHGTGELAIREFKLKPNVKVLQVVKDGNAVGINVDSNGLSQEIFVNGQWDMTMYHNKQYPTWQTGQRNELIYGKNGIVFWIVGDPRDGIDQNALQTIAASLQPMETDLLMHMALATNIDVVTLRYGEINGPFSDDLLAVYPDGSVTPYFTLIGSQPRPQPDSGIQLHRVK